MDTLKKLQVFTDKVNQFFLYILCFYLCFIVGACVLQVFSRYVLNSSFTWTEEMARYAFVSLGILGIPVALRKNLHVRVDVLEARLRRYPVIFKLQQAIMYLLIGYSSYILTVEGGNYMLRTLGSKTTAVRMPLEIVHITLPISGALCLWFCAMQILGIFYPESIAKPSIKSGGEEI